VLKLSLRTSYAHDMRIHSLLPASWVGVSLRTPTVAGRDAHGKLIKSGMGGMMDPDPPT